MDKTPKVFISYAWSTTENDEKIVSLAERLMSHGVQVVLDKWDLKEGQDKYVFMEQTVTDPTIDRVLIICDKTYKEKADSRKGGVGDETTIISAEVYGKTKQEKFIPIIFELDENGNAYCPAYMKSRIYIDLSSDNEQYEEEYEKLLRNIYEKPIYRKPVLGSRPEWLDDEDMNLSQLKDLIKQIKGCKNNKNKIQSLIRRFLDEFINRLKEFNIKDNEELTGELIVKKIQSMKPIRDIYIDFLENIIYEDILISNTITDFFENTYNSVLTLDENINSYDSNQFEHQQYLIWEMFICTITILFHYEKFHEIYKILNHTYFLKDSFFKQSRIEPKHFSYFRHYFRLIEENYKPKSNEPNLFTYSGKMLIEREKKPIINRDSLSMIDVLLCQLSYIFHPDNGYWIYWFPTTYVYDRQSTNLWIKLKSKSYCEKLYPLFAVKSIDELKGLIANHPIGDKMSYINSFESASSILTTIKIEEIGSLD